MMIKVKVIIRIVIKDITISIIFLSMPLLYCIGTNDNNEKEYGVLI